MCMISTLTYKVFPRLGLVPFHGHLRFPRLGNGQLHAFASSCRVEGARQPRAHERSLVGWIPANAPKNRTGS